MEMARRRTEIDWNNYLNINKIENKNLKKFGKNPIDWSDEKVLFPLSQHQVREQDEADEGVECPELDLFWGVEADEAEWNYLRIFINFLIFTRKASWPSSDRELSSNSADEQCRGQIAKLFGPNASEIQPFLMLLFVD